MPTFLTPMLPIFLLIALGATLAGSGFCDHGFRRQLERFVYWIALPCMLIVKLAEAPAVGADAIPMAAALGIATVATTLIATAAVCLCRTKPNTAGTFIQSSMRGNLAFTGLPIIALASHGDPATNAKAALVMGPMVVLFNALAVTALIAPQHKLTAALPLRVARSAITNPLILACIAGLILARTADPLTGPVGQTLQLLGQTAGPLALLVLGMAMLAYPVKNSLKPALASTAFKLILTPLIAAAAALWLGVQGSDLRTVLVFAAAPTAVASYVLTTQLKGDVELAAACIVVSTLLSTLALAAVLALTA